MTIACTTAPMAREATHSVASALMGHSNSLTDDGVLNKNGSRCLTACGHTLHRANGVHLHVVGWCKVGSHRVPACDYNSVASLYKLTIQQYLLRHHRRFHGSCDDGDLSSLVGWGARVRVAGIWRGHTRLPTWKQWTPRVNAMRRHVACSHSHTRAHVRELYAQWASLRYNTHTHLGVCKGDDGAARVWPTPGHVQCRLARVCKGDDGLGMHVASQVYCS